MRVPPQVATVLTVAAATLLVVRSAHGQVNAALHTAAKPQVVRPEDGERRILPDGRAIRLKVGPSTTGAGYLFLGAEELHPGLACRDIVMNSTKKCSLSSRAR